MTGDPTPPPEIPPESDSVGHVVQLRLAPGRTPRLFQGALVLVAAELGYLAYTAKVADPIHLDLGLAIVVLGFLPGLLWIKRAQFGLPIFETFMATTVTAYGIPLISGHDQLANYDIATITTAATAVVIYQVIANATYLMLPAAPRRSRLWSGNVVSGDISKFLGYGMALSTGYTIVEQFTTWIPANLGGAGQGGLLRPGHHSNLHRVPPLGPGRPPQVREELLRGAAGDPGDLQPRVALPGAGDLHAHPRPARLYFRQQEIPVFAVAALIPVFAVLHQGKSAMRDKYWEGRAPEPTILQIPGFFSEWVSDGLSAGKPGDEPVEKHSLLDRTSLIQILCLVVSVTPDRQPYLYGETYAQVPAQFVPRILWMGSGEKPVGHISTYTLAVYYGLQRMEDTEKTTIGFGLLTEAYANFGFIGIGLLAVAFGAFFKKICGWASESPILSYPGMILIVLVGLVLPG